MTARSSLRITVAAALLGSLALVAAPAAQAGQYQVDLCHSHESDAPAAVLAGLGPGESSVITSTNCAAGGAGVRAESDPSGSENEPELSLTVPGDRANVTIARVLTTFGATTPTPLPDGTTSFADLHALPTPGSDTAVASQQFAGSTTFVADRTPAAGTRGLLWRVDLQCESDRPAPGVAARGADCVAPCPSDRLAARADDGLAAASVPPSCLSVTLAKARLFLEESVGPVVTGVGGTLFTQGGQSGRRTVTFSAADADSGVAEVTVRIGGTVVGSVSYPCPGTDWSACARDRSGQTIEVDLGLAADASQAVTLAVRDAAGNVTTVAASGAGGGAGGVPGTVTLTSPTGGKTGPNGEAATTAARITAAFKGTKKRTRGLSFSSRPTVTGTLLRTAGGPIRGATIAVLERQRKAGGRWTQIGTAETGADGTYSFRVRGGPSRTLSFEYTASSSDTGPATTSRLYTKVRGSLSVKGSRRSVRVGAPFVISGKLRFLPRRGVQVTIQGYNRGRWQPVGNVKTDADGKFRWTYRFSAAGAFKTFGFRVRVDSPIYPFAAGNSRRILVSVRR